jgi:hypothetical protein
MASSLKPLFQTGPWEFPGKYETPEEEREGGLPVTTNMGLHRPKIRNDGSSSHLWGFSSALPFALIFSTLPSSQLLPHLTLLIAYSVCK